MGDGGYSSQGGPCSCQRAEQAETRQLAQGRLGRDDVGYARGGAYPTPPAPDQPTENRELFRVLEEQEQTISYLQDRARLLALRLEPIRRKFDEKQSSTTASAVPTTSPVGQGIQSLTFRLRSVAEELDLVIRELAI